MMSSYSMQFLFSRISVTIHWPVMGDVRYGEAIVGRP
jgi:hypothetical protein